MKIVCRFLFGLCLFFCVSQSVFADSGEVVTSTGETVVELIEEVEEETGTGLQVDTQGETSSGEIVLNENDSSTGSQILENSGSVIVEGSGSVLTSGTGENVTVEPEKEVVLLYLNEFVANVSGRDDGLEWIELFYMGSGTLLLNDYYLEIDDKKTINLTGIEIEDYYIINPDDFGVTLKNTNGKIALKKRGLSSLVEEIEYLKASEDASWRRSLKTNTWEEKPRPTKNAENILLNNSPQAFLSIQGKGWTSGEGSLSVNVTAEYSYDADGDDFTCFWDYGEGHVSDKCNPPSYKYGAGEFDLKLTVMDSFGGLSSAIQHISVKPLQNGGGSIAPVFGEQRQNFSDAIKINRFLPNPEGTDSETEWIEIINLGDENISLDWWKIDDEEGGSKPYTFPINTWIASEEALVFSILKSGLILNNTKDEVRLLSPDLNVKDSIAYENAENGQIYQRQNDGSWEWNNVEGEIILQEESETILEEEAVLSVQEFDFSLIEISEVLPSSSKGDKEFEWIELYNSGNESYDLAGWSLDDVINVGSQPYVFPQNTLIEPQGFLVIYSKESGLALNNNGDTVNLINAYGGNQDFFEYKKTAKDSSWAKNKKNRFVLSTFTTKGEPNIVLPKITQKDSDKDSVSDFDEINFYKTDPQNSDTDNDGIPDGFEVYNATNTTTELYVKYLQTQLKASLDETEDKKILVKGMAEPNSLVKIYIHSKLVVGVVQTDSKGSWSYEIPRELEAGNHKIETEIVTKDGFKMPKTHILNFKLQKDYQVKAESSKVKIDSILPNSEGSDELGEYFEVRNLDETSINLLNWKIVNQKKQSFIFPEIWLQPRETQKFFYKDTKITLNNTQGNLTLFNSQGRRTDFLSYADVQEGEIFTHQGGGIELTKEEVTEFVIDDYDVEMEIKGVVLSYINQEKFTFWFKNDLGQELQVQFNPQKYPLLIAELLFQKGNELLLRGLYVEEELFVIHDFTLLQQAPILTSIQPKELTVLNNGVLILCFFVLGSSYWFVRKKLIFNENLLRN